MKNLTVFYLFLLLSFNNYAASPVWKVEHKGNTTYLAGTIHLLRATDYPLPQAFNTAYQKSSIIVFETDLEALKAPFYTNKLIKSVRLAKGEHLLQYLKPKTQQALEQYCINNNIKLDTLSAFKPAFIALTLALTALRNIDVSQEGVDAFFNQKAVADKKQILGLETPDQQIKFLSQMGEGYENEFMMQTLNDIKDINDQFSDMIASWRNGNLKQIDAYFITPTKQQFPIMYQQLLSNRNEAWLPQLEHYLTTADTEMVMVGSAHLAGEDGLLKSLINMGYQITQLD